MQPPDLMRPQYISDELFHFFGRSSPLDNERNYELLKKVLACGCVSHPPHDVGPGTLGFALDTSKHLSDAEMFVPTVTCYCDIPYKLLAPHITKYGSFGLSFSRHHLTKFGARPVIYVPCTPEDWQGVFTGNTLLRELEATFLGVQEQRATLLPDDQRVGVRIGRLPNSVPEALEKAEHTLAMRVLAYIKPYESTLDESDPNYFYSEREWRKLGNLMFKASDVRRVIVDQSFLARAQEELPIFRDKLCSVPK